MLGLKQSDISQIQQTLASYPNVDGAVVFGSRAKGTQRKGSDVDLALEGKELTDSDIYQISDVLNEESRMPYFFDVLNIAKIENSALIGHIQRVGVRIYKKEF